MEAYDRDYLHELGDLIGRAVTDANGDFAITARPRVRDFGSGDARRPDLLFVVKTYDASGGWKIIAKTSVFHDINLAEASPVLISVNDRAMPFPFIVAPHRSDDGLCKFWIGWFLPGRPPAIQVRLRADRYRKTMKVAGRDWQKLGAGPDEYCYYTRLATSLPPRQRFSLEASVGRDEQLVGRGQFEVQPASLASSADDRGFTLFAASCYSQPQDEGRTAKAFKRLLQYERYEPHMKLFLGDQVYLDDEKRLPKKLGVISDRLLRLYRRTWTSDFRLLLESGCSAFTADDHEFWNNYPHASIVASSTLDRKKRQSWSKHALAFFRGIQSEVDTQQISVGRNLSMFVLETRVNRKRIPGREPFIGTDFSRPADINKLKDWVERLNGPGILALAQLVITERAALPRIKDANLANYEQYSTLVNTLALSKHDIVVVAGDVHFGGITETKLNAAGKRLIQVTSSPMSVFPVSESTFTAPDFYPAGSSSHTGTAVRVLAKAPRRDGGLDLRATAEHFVTLSFKKHPRGVSMEVNGWLIRERNEGRLIRMMRHTTVLR
ncbi:MAG: hypothetical protein AAFO81_06190 [Pseudomonadota bacterium]